MRTAGLLLAERQAEQDCPCPRALQTPLEILKTQQWFIRVLDAKRRVLAAGRQITWRPSTCVRAMSTGSKNWSWIWCISRQRFYGVPFPVWHCDQCDAIILADEAQLPVDPSADAPTRTCACGNSDLRPDPDVMDTWATSSVSPQIAARMFEDPSCTGSLPQCRDVGHRRTIISASGRSIRSSNRSITVGKFLWENADDPRGTARSNGAQDQQIARQRKHRP